MTKDINIKNYFPHQNTCNVNFRDRLLESWLGQMYRRYFKKIPAFRALIGWFWDGPVHFLFEMRNAVFSYKKPFGWRPVIRQDQYTKQFGKLAEKLAAPAIVQTPMPIFFPPLEEGYLTTVYNSYEFPEVYVSEIKNAVVYGNSNMVMTDEGIVCHDLYDFKYDKTSEELKMRVQIHPKRTKMRWMVNEKSSEYIEAVASFLDACSCNYAHWTTEVLPRIALFCANPRFKNIPIIIDSGLHPNIIESLSCMIGTEREVILLAPWTPLIVSKLYMTSVAGYITFDRRLTDMPWHCQGKFNPQALGLVRNQLIALALSEIKTPTPEKIYIKRTTGMRRVANDRDVENFLIGQGFSIIEPEKLTLLEQIKTYNKAKMIIGPTGAGMANILYAETGSRIFILMSKLHDNIYWYWQGIACATGNKVGFILGEIAGKDIGIHSDFHVDLKALAMAFPTPIFETSGI